MNKGIHILSFFAFFTVSLLANGQISDGGKPLQTGHLKSLKRQIIEMPKVDNFELLKASVLENQKETQLKPFRFAHSFPVNINRENNGVVYENIDGYSVWQVTIKSEGALSLNVIFNPYHVPPGAKLYILDQDQKKKLGAFTDFNNKEFNSFAVSPVAGDEITIQYEEPLDADFKGEIGISKINHDFVGVVAGKNERRPLGKMAGSCNVDVNCELAEDWESLKNSVCRIFIDGTEACTGTLVNNTSKDQKPYILTANHCYRDHINGEENSVFLFNYESPYCGNLDGDISNSISGGIYRANDDSLDFRLVEITIPPPPEFRPYYAGWDNSGDIPTSEVAIHHPQGDIKKISIDYDSPIIDSFNHRYVPDAFWRTLRWDEGTTEFGSSGCGYFNQDHQLIGTLTGGAASCSNSIDDYFSRFDIYWDYHDEQERQIKHWLDPVNTGILSLEGLEPYDGMDLCGAFTNMQNDDTHQLVEIVDGNDKKQGYWSGTNNLGITEFVDRFSIKGEETLEGISLGIGDLSVGSSSTGTITINVYNGTDFPEEQIYTQEVSITEFVNDAMNFMGFSDVVTPNDTFFIGFSISNLQNNDHLAVYQSYRESGENSLFLKQNGQWFDFSDLYSEAAGASLACEVIACNVYEDDDDAPNDKDVELDLYPNPTSSSFQLVISELISEDDIFVCDVLGKQANMSLQRLSSKRFKVTLDGNRAGIYFLRVRNEKFSISRKISYLPN